MSGFLLDTNVISELVKPRPEANVTAWIEGTDESLLYLSVLTLGEIRRGIASITRCLRTVNTLSDLTEKTLHIQENHRLIKELCNTQRMRIWHS